MLEPVLAGSLLSLATLSIVIALVAGGEGVVSLHDRTQGLYLAQEGIDALRMVRRNSFEELESGVWGLATNGTTWELSETPDMIEGRFERSITIEESESDVRDVAVRVTWDGVYGPADVILETRLTDW